MEQTLPVLLSIEPLDGGGCDVCGERRVASGKLRPSLTVAETADYYDVRIVETGHVVVRICRFCAYQIAIATLDEQILEVAQLKVHTKKLEARQHDIWEELRALRKSWCLDSTIDEEIEDLPF